MTRDQLLRLMDETRPTRTRLWNFVRGAASPYAQAINVYHTPTTDTAFVEAVQMFNEGLFNHDMHVTVYVCNEALGVLKQSRWATGEQP